MVPGNGDRVCLIIKGSDTPTYTVDGVPHTPTNTPFSATRGLYFHYDDYGDFVCKGGEVSGWGASTSALILEIVRKKGEMGT